MKKRIISIILVVALLVISISTLVACGDAPIADVEKKFIEGMANSITGENLPQVYKYKEKTLGDGFNTYTTVNVLPLMNDGSEDRDLMDQPVLGADGKLQNIMIEITDDYTVKETDDAAKIHDYIKYNAGLSDSGSKNVADIEYLFSSELMKNGKYNNKKQQVSTQAFLDSELFAQYALSTKFAELAFLSFDDLDFTIDEASHTITGEVTNMNFSVKESYFDKLYAEFGDDKVSIFDGAHHVRMEFTSGKLTLVSTYEEVNQGEMFGKPLNVINEVYSFMIAYYGPKIIIPEYTETTDKMPTWTDGTII